MKKKKKINKLEKKIQIWKNRKLEKKIENRKNYEKLEK